MNLNAWLSSHKKGDNILTVGLGYSHYGFFSPVLAVQEVSKYEDLQLKSDDF